MISDGKNQREGMTTLTTQNSQLMTRKTSVWDYEKKPHKSWMTGNGIVLITLVWQC